MIDISMRAKKNRLRCGCEFMILLICRLVSLIEVFRGDNWTRSLATKLSCLQFVSSFNWPGGLIEAKAFDEFIWHCKILEHFTAENQQCVPNRLTFYVPFFKCSRRRFKFPRQLMIFEFPHNQIFFVTHLYPIESSFVVRKSPDHF
jgi:hypothetical protein